MRQQQGVALQEAPAPATPVLVLPALLPATEPPIPPRPVPLHWPTAKQHDWTRYTTNDETCGACGRDLNRFCFECDDCKTVRCWDCLSDTDDDCEPDEDDCDHDWKNVSYPRQTCDECGFYLSLFGYKCTDCGAVYCRVCKDES